MASLGSHHATVNHSVVAKPTRASSSCAYRRLLALPTGSRVVSPCARQASRAAQRRVFAIRSREKRLKEEELAWLDQLLEARKQRELILHEMPHTPTLEVDNFPH
jgi:hypothetical protein